MTPSIVYVSNLMITVGILSIISWYIIKCIWILTLLLFSTKSLINNLTLQYLLNLYLFLTDCYESAWQ